MSNYKLELNRRRVLAGLGTIGLASAGAGAGTMALFSDQESSENNTVQAGTLDLSIDGNNDSATTTVDVGPIKPGVSGSGSSTLTNTGSIPGFLNADISNVTTSEGATPEPEQTGTDMRDELEVSVYFDDDGDTSDLSDGELVVSDDANNIGATYDDVDHPIAADGGSSNLVVEWALDRDAPNGIQGDSVSFDITVLLHQETDQ